MATNPEITEASIRTRVGPQSFDRGLAYFRDKAIFATRRRGQTIEARCHGSRGHAYRVEATFGLKGGLTAADCSCPVGDGGRCKHVAAMLLTWRATPDAFVETPSVDELLDLRTKDELIALIRQMLRRDPDLETLIEVTAPTTAAGRALGPPSAEVYRAQAIAAFEGADGDDYHDRYVGADEVAEELESIREVGDALLKRGDHAGASAVYRGIVDGVAEGYGSIEDYNGDVASEVSACVEGLGTCLTAIEDDPKAREAIIDALFRVYTVDVEAGGIDFGGDPIGVIESHATEAERARVGALALDAARRKTDRYDNYQRESYGELYFEFAKPGDEAVVAACRELGLTRTLIAHVLDEGKVAEAVEAVDSGGFQDSELSGILAIFEEHRQREAAERMIAKRAAEGKNLRLLEWLRDDHARKGHKAKAAEFAGEVFKLKPDLQQYRAVRKLAESDAERWAKLRASMLKTLAKSAEYGAIVRAHLEEGDVAKAIEALKPAAAGEWVAEEALVLDVARAAESVLPWEAIRLSKNVALALVGRRNRTAYVEACKLLKRVKALYTRYGEKTAWSRDLLAIRKAYRTLRAFHEELDKAGL